MRRYKHLTLEEREKLYAGKEAGKSLREIANELGRDHTTLSRELRRNARYGKPYIPCRAQAQADRVAKRQRCKAPLKEPLIFVYVRAKLRKGWSPEAIAGRLPIEHPGYGIDDETIYRYIYGRGKKYKLWKRLPYKRKKRMKKEGRKVRREKIKNAVPIDKRPQEAEERNVAGHWETDNMEGKRSDSSAVSVSVDRAARYTVLSKVSDKTAKEKNRVVAGRLLELPPWARQSLTADRGPENSAHEELSNNLRLDIYFCNPYHSWEKGTVENTIGRVRRFIPKGTSIDSLTEKELAAVEHWLNHTPRKCLGFLTPYEKMLELLSKR